MPKLGDENKISVLKSNIEKSLEKKSKYYKRENELKQAALDVCFHFI